MTIEKGAAPRITPDDIEANIAHAYFFTALEACSGVPVHIDATRPLSLLTICVLVLKNGFTVTGESACASPENFDADLGRKYAREAATRKVWPLMGYALRTELSRPALTEGDAAADLAGTPRPDHPTV